MNQYTVSGSFVNFCSYNVGGNFNPSIQTTDHIFTYAGSINPLSAHAESDVFSYIMESFKNHYFKDKWRLAGKKVRRNNRLLYVARMRKKRQKLIYKIMRCIIHLPK